MISGIDETFFDVVGHVPGDGERLVVLVVGEAEVGERHVVLDGGGHLLGVAETRLGPVSDLPEDTAHQDHLLEFHPPHDPVRAVLQLLVPAHFCHSSTLYLQHLLVRVCTRCVSAVEAGLLLVLLEFGVVGGVCVLAEGFEGEADLFLEDMVEVAGKASEVAKVIDEQLLVGIFLFHFEADLIISVLWLGVGFNLGDCRFGVVVVEFGRLVNGVGVLEESGVAVVAVEFVLGNHLDDGGSVFKKQRVVDTLRVLQGDFLFVLGKKFIGLVGEALIAPLLLFPFHLVILLLYRLPSSTATLCFGPPRPPSSSPSPPLPRWKG